MTKNGQIVLIPANSPLYRIGPRDYTTKEKELLHKAQPFQYSMFDGIIVGMHSGLKEFRLGQRKGVSEGGNKTPYYVIAKDESANRLFVGEGAAHPGLQTTVFHWPVSQEKFFANFIMQQSDEGVPVKVRQREAELSAQFYIFPSGIFLQFRTAVSITLLEQPLTVHFHDNSSLDLFSNFIL